MSNSSDGPVVPTPEHILQVTDLYITNYVGFFGFTVLVYDHMLTFADEVKYIWKAPKDVKKPIIWLFLINRYVTPLGFIVNLNAFLSPAWDFATCSRFVLYEGVMGFIGVAIASLMMIVRVHAIYAGDRYVMSLLWLLFAIFVGVHAWLFTTTGPVQHPGITGCSLLFGVKPEIGHWTSATAWSPLLLDTAVITAVVWRTHTIVKAKINKQSKVVNVLIKDGLMYYTVIFAVNLVLAIMIVSAPDGIKNLCAQLQLMLTVTMMSRITLSLRRNLDSDNQDLLTRNVDIDLSEHSMIHLHLTGLDAPPKALRNFGLHATPHPV